ncbi:nuclear transport factor 2 family protein [Pseudomonas marginalis]|uniref:nuclear transport factor 2 family protein n=1 Tax=Pseudomonas marginalis TaxID=298 RepID=UPI003CCAB138
MPQIDILNTEKAQGIWTLEDWLYTPAGTFHGQGHYHETYVKFQGKWRIQHLCLSRQHVQSDL